MTNEAQPQFNREKVAQQDIVVRGIRKLASTDRDTFLMDGIDFLDISEIFDIEVPDKAKQVLSETYLAHIPSRGNRRIAKKGVEELVKTHIAIAGNLDKITEAGSENQQ